MLDRGVLESRVWQGSCASLGSEHFRCQGSERECWPNGWDDSTALWVVRLWRSTRWEMVEGKGSRKGALDCGAAGEPAVGGRKGEVE